MIGVHRVRFGFYVLSPDGLVERKIRRFYTRRGAEAALKKTVENQTPVSPSALAAAEALLADPDTMIQVLQALKAEREKVAALEREVERLKGEVERLGGSSSPPPCPGEPLDRRL